ncbi:MAG: cysteine--tRNA ligase, partial [Anaplasmataceae bacterium]|nr:cysteine--tRNA ligase [Anaplasmataceae bacterium]
NPDKITIYACGPTVYDYPHIGNARSAVVADMTYRVLSLIYNNITYVQNITDIDDKIINRAKELNIHHKELAIKYEEIFKNDIKWLKCKPPTEQPRATESLDDIIKTIQKLIDNGYAYITEQNVYFSVNKYKNYGQLSGHDINDQMHSTRIEAHDDKKNPHDFVLWKFDNKVYWDSPWGKGRPGWHIECTAMSTKYLGETFDIHLGGMDLKFPHHENELTQGCCANLNSEYARYWMHNGLLTINQAKMSKSVGNIITINKLKSDDWSAELIRYIYFMSHYRKPLDWNQNTILEAKQVLIKFYKLIEGIESQDGELFQEFLQALLNDFNTPYAISIMHKMVDILNKKYDKSIAGQLKMAGNLLGILEENPKEEIERILKSGLNLIDEEEVDRTIAARAVARKNKNFIKSDMIRDHLQTLNIEISDKSDESGWFYKESIDIN